MGGAASNPKTGEADGKVSGRRERTRPTSTLPSSHAGAVTTPLPPPPPHYHPPPPSPPFAHGRRERCGARGGTHIPFPSLPPHLTPPLIQTPPDMMGVVGTRVVTVGGGYHATPHRSMPCRHRHRHRHRRRSIPPLFSLGTAATATTATNNQPCLRNFRWQRRGAARRQRTRRRRKLR